MKQNMTVAELAKALLAIPNQNMPVVIDAWANTSGDRIIEMQGDFSQMDVSDKCCRLMAGMCHIEDSHWLDDLEFDDDPEFECELDEEYEATDELLDEEFPEADIHTYHATCSDEADKYDLLAIIRGVNPDIKYDVSGYGDGYYITYECTLDECCEIESRWIK